ncbi:MAG: CinA family protein [Ruminococcus sp.]|nr:CinA family protein [Ruminococcus sp.]
MLTLEEQLVDLLAKRQWTITTAESCTGGMIAGTIVNVAGASDVFNEGYVTYSNEAKHRLIGVSEETLKTFGAVSEQTAEEMARGAAVSASSNLALSATGVAGPGGGTPEKPVGLVYIGCFLNGQVKVKECRFDGNRTENRKHTVEEVLKFAIEMIRAAE